MINLNDERFEDKAVKIFNGGEAGVVLGCGYHVVKKTKEDSDNSPLYKLYIVDDAGGEINRGYYTNFKSEKAEEFFVREMKHLIRAFRLELPTSYDSYDDMLSTVMKGIRDKEGEYKINVAVCYGSESYPKRFLELDGFWGLMNSEDGIPKLSPNALRVRPVNDDEQGQDLKVTKGTEDEEEW